MRVSEETLKNMSEPPENSYGADAFSLKLGADLRDARAALRLAVEAMEKVRAYPGVESHLGKLTYHPMVEALAACRKVVGE